MPSPFPGMDPYLEGAYWSTFRLSFTVEIAHQLRDILPSDCFALIDSYPIVTLDSSLRALPTPETERERAPNVIPPLYLNLAIPHTVGMSFVRIQDVATRQTHAVVHLLDPLIKKNPGGRHYLRWRAKLLAKPISLIEIDLLRHGRRPPMLDAYPDSSYCVMINDPELRPCCELWPVALDQPLPTIRVQLARKRVVQLDLQDTFAKTYDRSSFERMLHYDDKPEIPLSHEGATWADRILREHRTEATHHGAS
jgi:hypothetical protein